MEMKKEAIHSGENSVRAYYLVYLALMVLLAATVGVAFVNLGSWNIVVALIIASVKATLVLLIFMHLKDDNPLIWLVLVTAGAILLIALVLTLSDYLVR
jgi:cytochrome c oxidase subunit IV